jgi:hypothetical protein
LEIHDLTREEPLGDDLDRPSGDLTDVRRVNGRRGLLRRCGACYRDDRQAQSEENESL